MPEKKWRKRMKRLIPGALLCAIIVGQTQCAFAQQISLGLPWRAGQIWKVLQSYHGSFGSGEHALDFKPANSADNEVVAPASGMVYAGQSPSDRYTPCETDLTNYRWESPLNYIRLDLLDGSQIYFAHLSGFAHGLIVNGSGLPVKKGEVIGYIGSSGCTWKKADGSGTVHLDFTLVQDGVSQLISFFEGTIVKGAPATTAHADYSGRTNMSPIREEPGYSYRNHPGGYPDGDQYQSINTPSPLPFPIGSLIRLKNGDGKVFLVSVDDTGNIVKRWVRDAATFTLNGFSWSDVFIYQFTVYVA